VPWGVRCNRVSDCWDDADEDDCDFHLLGYSEAQVKFPAIIHFNKHGYFSQEAMHNNSCPETHYRCVSQDLCLPVYTRCNGYFDCLDREDELDCDIFECPGYYRCLDSQVCLHPDHVCDGWAQCPQRDDEWLCDERPCPETCLCHGLAFVCDQPFHADLYPQLRYLDGAGSGMTPDNLTSNLYLVNLILSRCGFLEWPGLYLPNLKNLDMSYNGLLRLNLDIVLNMSYLVTLSVAHNPLTLLFKGESQMTQRSLTSVDLSYTDLRAVSSEAFSRFSNIKSLNLSHSQLNTVGDSGFNLMPMLATLDLSASPVVTFPEDVFLRLTRLQRVATDNYKLCCPDVLPDYFKERNCLAPRNELSSCQDLLRAEGYRVFFWLMCVCAVTGNVFCLVFRFCLQRKASKGAFNTFVSSLGVADFLMGVYLVIIGSADVTFQGRYARYEWNWLNSAACKVAGFLSLLSSEVSALIILLITLDRFLVLRFPFSSVRFGNRSALAACLATWSLGFVLAVVPLLPVTSHWQFYSQTGICIPLPVTRQDFAGRSYSTGVMIIFNFVLFLLIAAGQAFIYWSVQKNAMTTDTTKKMQDATVARRLITVAVSDFLCWFPIGLCGLLALTGVPIPGEVSVAMAIFVLPLNSALNPFLYTYNVIAEKHRQTREGELLKTLQSTLNEASYPPQDAT
jgi:hypothetical protein